MTPTQLRELVLSWLGYAPDETGPDIDAADVVVPAVVSWVDGLPSIDREEDGTWGAKTILGATLLGARLVRRRNSPAGIESFTVDGAAYVRRTDPDISAALHLADHAKPKVG